MEPDAMDRAMPDAGLPDRAAHSTVDPGEIERFTAVAEQFWDPEGPYRPLHRLNPVRLGYIRDALLRRFARQPDQRQPFTGLRLLDVGCGGGLAAEPMARLGFDVTAIDAADANITAARLHAEATGVQVDYRATSAEALLAEGEGSFDVVLALEIVEHVADLDAFCAALAGLLRPGGMLILSTLNRTTRSYLLGIVAAERVLRWVPRGTHEWRKFLKPSELARALRPQGLHIEALTGVAYDGARDGWKLTTDVGVNYMAVAVKPG